MRNPVDTNPEVKRDIEKLTDEMITNAVDAKESRTTLLYYICKYNYNSAISEIKEKGYRDIMIVDFPKPEIKILPEKECQVLDLIHKFKSAKIAELKTPYYKAVKDICRGIK